MLFLLVVLYCLIQSDVINTFLLFIKEQLVFQCPISEHIEERKSTK